MASNPKEILRQLYGKGRASAFESVTNPIGQEIRDLERYRKFNAYLYPLMPFMADGDANIALLQKMRNLSPTHGGIIGNIKRFVLGSGLEVEKRLPTGWKLRPEQETQTTEEEFFAFSQFLEDTGVTGLALREALERMYENYKPYGNAYLELVLTRVEGRPYARIHAHDADTVRYLITEDLRPRILAISPKWDYEYLYRYPPDFVPLYPQMLEEGDTQRTMFHLKDIVSGYNWYGLPDWLSSLYFAYGEIQQGQFYTEEFANDFVGKVFLEYESVDTTLDEYSPEEISGEDVEFANAVREVFTRGGKGNKKSSVLLRAKLPDSDETKVHEFKIQTNEKQQQLISEINEKQLFKSHQWHPALMLAISGQLGLSKELYELIRYKQKTVVEPIQAKLTEVLNQAILAICEFAENSEMQQYRLSLSNLFEEMLQDDPTEATGGTAGPEGETQAERDVLDVSFAAQRLYLPVEKGLLYRNEAREMLRTMGANIDPNREPDPEPSTDEA